MNKLNNTEYHVKTEQWMQRIEYRIWNQLFNNVCLLFKLVLCSPFRLMPKRAKHFLKDFLNIGFFETSNE